MTAEIIITTTPNEYNPRRDAWKWVAHGYYADGRLEFTTVHKTDFSKDMEVRAATNRESIARVEVLTWREAGRPRPQYRMG